jgi:hypothetical protein
MVKLFWLIKKNDPSVVKNFRPFCLTDAISKIFTQYLVIHASRHMRFNKYMSNTQKGFLEDISGCVEHQFLLEFAINKARKIGRSNVILVMTDLSNAFGSVRHKLIEFALKHYHFSNDFIDLLIDMYDDLSISLTVNKESQVISQKIGVFQGDPLSPILFNIVINMILEPLNYPHIVKQHGITLFKQTRTTNMAFADDINILGRSIESTTSLLKIFQNALDWTRCLKAEPSKFGAIAYGKVNGIFQTFDPLLQFGDYKIPFLDKAVQDKFRLLGRQFSTDLNNDSIRFFVKDKIFEILSFIDKDSLPSHLKLSILHKAVAYFRWHLTVHFIPSSWLKEHVMPEYIRYCKKWFGGAKCQNTDLYFSSLGFGFNIPDLICLNEECQIQRSHILKNSLDLNIRTMFSETLQQLRKMRSDGEQHRWKGPLALIDLESQAKNHYGLEIWSRFSFQQQRYHLSKVVRKRSQQEHKETLLNLEMQGAAHHSVIEGSQDFDWMHQLTGLSKSLLKFGVNAVTNTLPTMDNLKRWGYLRSGDDICTLCGESNPTITHVLSMCKGALGERSDEFNRIKWRHNNVLSEFMNSVSPHLVEQGFKVFIDLEGHPNHYRNFPIDIVETSMRPDVILWNVKKRSVILAELTCPMEHNLEAAFIRKKLKYTTLQKELEEYGLSVLISPFEVSARGICAVTVSELLREIGYGKKKSAQLKYRLSKIALSSSQAIFLKRNNRYWMS